MATLNVYPVQDLIRQLTKMERIDEIAPKMIKAAQPVLQRNLRKQLQTHTITGGLEQSIACDKPKKHKNTWVGVVYAKGENEDGKRYGEILAYLELGTSHQKPHPVISPAVLESQSEMEARMREVFDSEVKP